MNKFKLKDALSSFILEKCPFKLRLLSNGFPSLKPMWNCAKPALFLIASRGRHLWMLVSNLIYYNIMFIF